jgi:hypothetical protein
MVGAYKFDFVGVGFDLIGANKFTYLQRKSLSIVEECFYKD